MNNASVRHAMKNRLLGILGLTLCITIFAFAQDLKESGVSARAEVLVLGTYHMSNPGHDIYNMQADDVLSPKRQAELAQLIEALKKFHPTKVAVEADIWNKHVPEDYAGYLAGNHELTRNEIEQVGFRLAKELGQKAIWCVDADGDFPWQRVVDYARGTGRSGELDSVSSGWAHKVKAQNAYLASHTILETLLFMNSDEQVTIDVRPYYRMAKLGEPGDWAGGDLLAEWFRRNIRIYGNVMKLIDSPNERVLVIFGSGHLGWLRHDFLSNPDVRLRKPEEFAN